MKTSNNLCTQDAFRILEIFKDYNINSINIIPHNPESLIRNLHITRAELILAAQEKLKDLI